MNIWRHCDVIIGRGKSKLGVGLFCTAMIIVCKFHDPSIIGSGDTEGGSEEPSPQSQIDEKSPVWIGVNIVARTCAEMIINGLSNTNQRNREFVSDVRFT